MTEKELMGLVYMRAHIDKLIDRISEMEDEPLIGSMNMDGMPRGSTPGNPVERLAMARAALHEKLLQAKAAAVEKELEIREYMDGVEDAEIKLIIEMRCIQGKDWYSVATELGEIGGGIWIDRSTPAKKLRKYLQEHPN